MHKIECITDGILQLDYYQLHIGERRLLMERDGKTIIGIDMEATGKRIAGFIDNSGFSDKELGRIMGLSVQSINKWRHGRCLPDIENIFVLSRILGVKIDDFFVPRTNVVYKTEEADTASMGCRLMSYYKRLKSIA